MFDNTDSSDFDQNVKIKKHRDLKAGDDLDFLPPGEIGGV